MHLFYEPCLLLNSTRRGCSPQLTRDDKVTWGRWPGTGRELSLRSRPCTQGPRSLFCMQHLLRGCLLLCEFLCWHIFSLLLGTNLEELLGHMVSLCLSFLRNVPDCSSVTWAWCLLSWVCVGGGVRASSHPQNISRSMAVHAACCEFSDFVSQLLCRCLRRPAACSSLAGTSLSLCVGSCRFLSVVWGRDVLRHWPVWLYPEIEEAAERVWALLLRLENNFHIGSVLKWIPHWQKYNSWGFSRVASSTLPMWMFLSHKFMMFFHKGLERWKEPH